MNLYFSASPALPYWLHRPTLRGFCRTHPNQFLAQPDPGPFDDGSVAAFVNATVGCSPISARFISMASSCDRAFRSVLAAAFVKAGIGLSPSLARPHCNKKQPLKSLRLSCMNGHNNRPLNTQSQRAVSILCCSALAKRTTVIPAKFRKSNPNIAPLPRYPDVPT